ncbi:hypothetical protein FCH28_30310 [Streptomyces piniterrae]|uniref:Uncharacterized protein n=1 Tax=Streptomyces piniterrae TaxID=2571125 RepID=A0A4U0MUK1_9ACTN|nr:hypothetical protein [Streptomyces piniterrae]TJZ44613.1 hypothetical protein FCH28_30310 [Streptomyces piniterrae]
MQDKGNVSETETTESELVETSKRRRIGRWLKRRRSVVANGILRGAAYGIGAGGIGLIVWWIENH